MHASMKVTITGLMLVLGGAGCAGSEESVFLQSSDLFIHPEVTTDASGAKIAWVLKGAEASVCTDNEYTIYEQIVMEGYDIYSDAEHKVANGKATCTTDKDFAVTCEAVVGASSFTQGKTYIAQTVNRGCNDYAEYASDLATFTFGKGE